MRRTLFVSFLIALGALFVYSVPATFANHKSNPETVKKQLPDRLKALPGNLEKMNTRLVQMIQKKSGPIVGIGVQFGEWVDDDTARGGKRYIPVVKNVMTGGPADKSGVRPGDIILSVNGNPFDSPEAFLAAVRGDDNPGRKVTLELNRSGQNVAVTMTTGVLSNSNDAGERLQKAIAEEGKALVAKVKTAADVVTKALEDVTFDVTDVYEKSPKDPRLKALTQALDEYYVWHDNKRAEAKSLQNE